MSTNQKYAVTRMTCSACAQAVERAVKKLPGIDTAQVNLMTNTLRVHYDPARVTDKDIISAVQNAGYGAQVFGTDAAQRAPASSEERDVKVRLVGSFAMLVPLMYLAMGHMIGLWMPPVFVDNPMVMALAQLLLTVPVLFLNRSYFITGFRALFKGHPNMDSLIAVGSGAAALYSMWMMFDMALFMGAGNMDKAMHHAMNLYFESAATILTLITLGKYFEARSKGKTTDAIQKLLDLAPQMALVEREGGLEERLPIEQVQLGDVVILKPGDAVPVDGAVIFGASAIDESALTGESIPSAKGVGDRVSQGTVNKNGTLKVRVDRLQKDTTLSQIVRLVEEAGASKAPIGRLADRISGIFVPVVIGIALVSLCVWLMLGKDIGFAIAIATSVLVISCPCALGLATPVAIMVGTGRAASLGCLFKSAEALEGMHAVNAVVLDKTGTVTMGRPEVTDVVAQGIEGRELLTLAASIEKPSEHPLADAVLARAQREGLSPLAVEDFEAVPGRGVVGTVGGERVLSGNRQLMQERGIHMDAMETQSQSLLAAGKTCLFFAKGDQCVGLLAVADPIKPSSAEAVRGFHKLGIETVMLTGDNSLVARAVAKELGIGRVRAEVLPEDKEKEVRALQAEGKKVAMIGDGINDAPALARANVGIAIGAGTDIAIESADVVLMKSDLMDAVDAIRLGRATIRNIKENLFWAFFYNTVGIPLAAGVFYSMLGWKLSPMIGALAMSLSSICVVGNALRLRRFAPLKRESQPDCADACPAQVEAPDMVLHVPSMMCDHCKRTVEGTLNALPGVAAQVDLERKTVNVYNRGQASFEQMRDALLAEDYQATLLQKD